MVCIINIETELKQVQIKHIQKELEQLRLYYDDAVDVEFLYILCSYEEMLELASTLDEKLLIYKKMYQDSLEYIFNDIQNTQCEEDILENINENINIRKEDDKLPF